MQQTVFINYDEVPELLKEYTSMKDRITNIQGELEQVPLAIDAGAHAGSAYAHVIGIYAKLEERHRQQEKLMREELAALECVTGRLERAISYLPDRERQAIDALYIRHLTFDKASESLYIARSTLNNRRREAIEALCLAL